MKTPSNTRGSALLLVLCAVALMSVAVISLVKFADLGLSEMATQEKDFRAMQLAISGLAVGQFPDLEEDDPVLSQTINSTESFSVVFKSEGGKLNINAILLGQQQEVLDSLFERWGLKQEDRAILIDCLMDWVDGDPLKRLNGAEQREYEAKGLIGYPLNRPFQDLEEMELVFGMATLKKVKPDWKDYFTVWTDGKLDLNEAPSDLVAAVCGVGSFAADNLVKRRLGPDSKLHTSDDYRYTEFSQVRSILGLTEQKFSEVERKVTLKSDYRRIESTGKVGSHERKVAVVVQIGVTPAQFLTWIEY